MGNWLQPVSMTAAVARDAHIDDDGNLTITLDKRGANALLLIAQEAVKALDALEGGPIHA